MSVSKYVFNATRQLYEAGIRTARLDALVLLEDALGMDRTQLLAHPEWEISAVTETMLNEQLARRTQHEPLAYIRGKAEFYGREFVVSSAVLVPRPESEIMIEQLLMAVDGLDSMHHDGRNLRIADIGTGSGALGITAALELPAAVVELVDIDTAAIKIAETNVIKHTTDISVRQSDLLPDDADYDVVLANLPYVPDAYPINRAADYEPAIALYAGSDGLELYQRFFEQLRIARHKPLLLLLESFPDQHDALQALAADAGYSQQAEQDFIQVFRLIGRSR